MGIPPKHVKDVEAMPAALRRLVEEELAAGNEIAEVGHSFPAAPVGWYVKLTRPVSSRPRASSEGIRFFERNSSLYSGEFADLNRHFFVIEPPHPPPPEPDMNAIRAAAQPKGQPLTVSVTPMPSAVVAGSTLHRFQGSMIIDYEKWHDGIGGVLNRAGDVAVHFAAMLMFLHGKAREAFDWEQRPFFLEFNTDDGAERRKRFRELCEKIGVNADEMMKRYQS